jgi:hypothetical protein
MLTLSATTRVFFCTQPVDMRKSFDGLFGLVSNFLSQDPLSGHGVLRLRHHGRQGLNAKALAVLTILHNYAIRRADGTTAAERFFGHKPADLFEWLLERLPELPRPAKSREHAA